MSRKSSAVLAAEPVIAVRGLRKRFADGPFIIDDVDLDVGRSSAVAIIGANGTGKSTLVRMLVRLVEPSDGTIHLLGRDVRSLSGRDLSQLRARVGFVFQKHNLVSRLSALTNVVHGAQGRERGMTAWHQALAPTRLRDEALNCLGRVGLLDKAMARVDTLSGGQSQRVAIARMLMQRPEIVLADEPDASLDPKAGEEVMELLVTLCRAHAVTLLVVSHRMEHALRFSDRIIGLASGRIALDKPSSATDEAELASFFRHG